MKADRSRKSTDSMVRRIHASVEGLAERMHRRVPAEIRQSDRLESVLQCVRLLEPCGCQFISMFPQSERSC